MHRGEDVRRAAALRYHVDLVTASVTTDYDFDQLATERPHAGVARAYQPIGLPPPAKPKARALPPHHNDPEYWILAALWRPMDVATIARLTGFAVIGVKAHLQAMQGKRRVYELDGGLWGKV